MQELINNIKILANQVLITLKKDKISYAKHIKRDLQPKEEEQKIPCLPFK